jgi:DNA-binding transcriptional LysR family regulator
LFERTTKRFRITNAGADFLPVVERILDDLQAGIDNVVASAQMQKGLLAIGSAPLLTATLVSELLADYRRDYPRIDIRLEDTSTSELIRLLRNRSIEIALGTFSKLDADLTMVPLFEDPLVALAHTSLRLPDACSWSMLAQRPLISIIRSSSVGELIDRTVWKVTGQAYQPMMESHHWSTVISLAESLQGVCVVPAYAARIAEGRSLKKIDLVEPEVLRTISVAYLTNRELSPAGQAFLALLYGDSRFKRKERALASTGKARVTGKTKQTA